MQRIQKGGLLVSLPIIKTDLVSNPNYVLCVGCQQEIPKAFSSKGKIWTRVWFLAGKKQEMVYDPVTGLDTLQVTEQKRPIDDYVKGYICPDCAADSSMIEKKRKVLTPVYGKKGLYTGWHGVDKGETESYYIPKVVLDYSPSQSQTLESGDMALRMDRVDMAKAYKDWQVDNGLIAAPKNQELPMFNPKREGKR